VEETIATITGVGFKLNPYDFSVANKKINGQKCTITWHIDDLKISHVDSNVVSDIIKKIDKVFGRKAPLTITRGKKLEYLGMLLDFSEKKR
jgi:hypothetical protein